jgi:membrane peptidoglycan carboxypeptidase
MAIGQGYVEASPLQVHGMTMAIANMGRVLRPRVVRQIVDSDGNVLSTASPDVMRTLEIEQRHLATTIQGMELGFNGPLLRDYKIPGLRVAAKTGTAEYGQATNPQGELPTHGWFTGFAPAEDPKVVVTVFVERGSSTRDAAPIATRIIRRIFGLPDVPPRPPGQPTPQAAPGAAPARPQVGVPIGPSGQPASGNPAPPSGNTRPAPAPGNAAPSGGSQPSVPPAILPSRPGGAPAAQPTRPPATAAPRNTAPPPGNSAPANPAPSGPGLFNPSFPSSGQPQPKPRN